MRIASLLLLLRGDFGLFGGGLASAAGAETRFDVDVERFGRRALVRVQLFRKTKKKRKRNVKKKKKNNASDPDGTDSLGEPQCESKKTEKKGKATSRNVMRSIQCND